MRLIVNGFLTDYKGRILLQKAAENALAPVGRPMEPGVLPAETLARAFREETGLIVMPVRMTGLYYDGGGRPDELIVCYRCTMRGGDLAVPEGRSPAGFFDCPPLPRGLSVKHRRQVDVALHHAGGPPLMERKPPGVSALLGRIAERSKPAADVAPWAISVQLDRSVEGDGVEWVISDSAQEWPATAAPVGDGEAPWETAGRTSAVRLVRAEVAADRPAMNLVFALA